MTDEEKEGIIKRFLLELPAMSYAAGLVHRRHWQTQQSEILIDVRRLHYKRRAVIIQEQC
jgi:hypothetical protein